MSNRPSPERQLQRRESSGWRSLAIRLSLLSVAFLLSAVLPPSPTQAQGGYSPWRTFNQWNSGLEDNYVWFIVEDKDGALWFGTGGGVSRYDGRSWQTFTTQNSGLASDFVSSILEDKEGALWFGTWGAGVSRYDGQSWQTFTPQNSGLAGSEVRSILEDKDGALWFATGGGVSRYDGQSWQIFTPQNSGLAGSDVRSILEDKDGALWFATWGAGVSRYDGQSWQTFTPQNSGLAGDVVYSILEDKDGTLWFGTWGVGVSRYDKGAWQTFTTQNSGLAGSEVRSILEDKDGALWFATWGAGVSRYDGRSWQTFTTQNSGLAANGVYSILEDEDGTLWFGTEGGGVSRYDGRSWQIFTTESSGLAGDVVRSILQDKDGALWFGTWRAGVSRYDEESWQTFTPQNSALADYIVTSVLEDRDGALWFGTWGAGVSRYDGRSWQTFTTDNSGLAHNTVRSILEDKDGALWFATWGEGVSRFDGTTWTTYTNEDGLAANSVLAIALDKDGALWLCTWGAGVSRYDGQSWQTFNHKNSGLAGDYVRSIVEDKDGALWFGTWGAGVSRYDGQSWQTFNHKNSGLAANGVYSILEDKDGTLWFGTEGGGVSRYDGWSWQTFTPQNSGLAGDVVRSILEDKDGALWFGTGDGVSRYRAGKGPPLVRLEKLTVAGGQTYTDFDQIVLSHSENDVTIEFAGGDLKTDPEDLIFIHIMEGYDPDWRVTTKPLERTARYFNLAPGTYTFFIKARDLDFNYSEPAKAQITVQPPPLIEISKTTITLPWFGTIPLVDFYRGLVGLSIAPLLALLILSLSRWRAYSRARRAIARGYNPYIAGRPITGAEMFFGRKEALAAVINGLPNHFAIHGVRRIGKTSLLRQLEHQIEQLQDPGRFFIPVSLNLQRVPQERLFHSLASAIADRCQAYTSPLNLIYNQKGPKDYDDFDLEDDIKAILAALKEATGKKGQIVLLLDEGDRINEYERQTQHQLRSIFQGKVQEHLTLVWAGVSIASIKDDTSPWYNLFAREIRLAPFTEEDALALIQEPVKGIYEYDTEAVRRILHYSQRQPYRIQQICHAVINLMLSERRRPHLFRSVRIRADDVEKAYEGLIAEEAERAKRPYEAEPLAEGVAEEGVTYQSGEEKGDAG